MILSLILIHPYRHSILFHYTKKKTIWLFKNNLVHPHQYAKKKSDLIMLLCCFFFRGTNDVTVEPDQVRSSETNKDFVSRNFAYYDCSRHTTCGTCVKAQWACNWCVHENRCTHNASTCQRTVVSGENVKKNLKKFIFKIYFFLNLIFKIFKKNFFFLT